MCRDACVCVGLEPTGNVVGAPARFTVETSAAGSGELEVIVLNPKGTPEKVMTDSSSTVKSINCLQIRQHVLLASTCTLWFIKRTNAIFSTETALGLGIGNS